MSTIKPEQTAELNNPIQITPDNTVPAVETIGDNIVEEVNEVPVPNELTNEVPVNDQITNEVPVNEVPVNDQVTNDQITNEVPVNDQVTNDQVTNDQVTNDQITNEQVTNEVPVNEQITLTIDKSTLVALCQNLNTNLLVNIAAYKSVITKLKDSQSNKTELESNIQKLNEIEKSVSDLMNSVQKDLDVQTPINPETVIQEASGSSSFMQKLLGAEAAAILGSMTAATVLMLGGGRKIKITKRKRNKGNKKTKRTNKL